MEKKEPEFEIKVKINSFAGDDSDLTYDEMAMIGMIAAKRAFDGAMDWFNIDPVNIELDMRVKIYTEDGYLLKVIDYKDYFARAGENGGEDDAQDMV